MPCFRYRALLIPMLLLGTLPTSAVSTAAEPSPAPDTRPSLFRQIIKQPTGKNGYEELLQAADALSASKLYRNVEQPEGGQEVTLAMKRRVLLDPPVVRALALLRRGLAKPVFAPGEDGAGDALFSVSGHFRSLARLLQLQQYVFLADGRVPDAIANVRLALKFGDAVQTDSLISGLVGVAISALPTSTLGAHLDQLSARDCEMLYQVCVEWLGEPSPLSRMLEGERRVMKQHLAEMKGQVSDAALLQAERQLNDLLDRQIAELGKPAWERSPVSIRGDGSMGAALAATLLPAMSRVSDGYTSQEARIRLLACHAAIRRYRWEHDRLPDTLTALNLGDLAIDPFTGKALQYERQGARYRLTSGGPAADAGDARAVNGRRPISIVPGEP